MKLFNCPKCGEDITDSYDDADFDVGIMSAGWFCDKCDEFYVDDHQDDLEFFPQL